MSKWLDKSKFNKFKTRVNEEADRKPSGGAQPSFEYKWDTPKAGTADKDAIYKLRLLPDPEGRFYEKMMYHMYKVGEQWHFSICPKTFDYNNFCPVCAVTQKLYKGGDADRNEAYAYKRKEKYVTNMRVVNDPRDEDKDKDAQANGKVLIYEFPTKVENKIRDSINDTDEGVGYGAYDPGEEGFDFIVKIGLTKPQADGKQWPDYTNSNFARMASPVGDSDEEINEVMKQTHDLEKYMKQQTLSNSEKIVQGLKDNLVFELIEEDYDREMKRAGVVAKAKASNESVEEKAAPKQEAKPKEDPKPEPKDDEVPTQSIEDDGGDELEKELLDELNNI